MSTQNIDAMLRDAELDSEFAEHLGRARDLAELVRLGAERGYDFTKHELEAYLKPKPRAELSEEELETVAAGTAALVASPFGAGTSDSADQKSTATSGTNDTISAGDLLLHRWQR